MLARTSNIQKNTYEALKSGMGYKSPMQAPRIEKIVISSGVAPKYDPKKRELIKDRIARLTGQAPAERAAKKSIATFKIRTGDVVGYQVTLRGARMQAFFDKLIHVVLPRMKDFRGIRPQVIDEMGNLTLGMREHIVFPETSDEESKDIFGLAITITTTAKNKKEAESFFRHIGLPLREK